MTTKRRPQKRTLDFLLEIGCEEVPSGCVVSITQEMRSSFAAALSGYDITAKEVVGYGTPRRFVLYAKGVSVKQPDKTVTVLGPSRAKAFDSAGRPTQQACGFATAHNVDVSELEIHQTPRGEYVALKRLEQGRDTRELLTELIPPMVTGLPLPKNMRWDGGTRVAFIRPIRWLLALVDDTVLRCEIAGVVSQRETYPRSFASGQQKRVSAIKDYFKLLQAESAILDAKKREQKIVTQLNTIGAKENAKVIVEEGLLEEVTHLVEAPCVFCGDFAPRFLELPKEVLLCSLSKYQRLFALQTSRGKLIPKFLGVLDGRPLRLSEVRKNYQQVLEARLADSLFFYREDLKTPLSLMRERLKHLIFHQELGSVYEKTERMKAIAALVCESLCVPDETAERLKRACELSKSDLTSHVVREFPSLQGVMGLYYAMAGGEDHAVASGISEQYLPKTQQGILPRTQVGTFLSLIDKLDLIIGCFAVGIMPTGSADPYGIRRAGSGFVSIVLHNHLSFSLGGLLEKVLELYGAVIKTDMQTVAGQLREFFVERSRSRFLQDRFRYDVVDAVIAGGLDDIAGAFAKIKLIKGVLNEDYFLKSWKVVERTNNILKGTSSEAIGAPSPECFSESLEHELFSAYKGCRNGFLELCAGGDYKRATELYGSSLYGIVHVFFDKVLINVDDQRLRENRLALMKAINTLYTGHIADLSLLVMGKEQNEQF
ncbi:MAG: glycine--tRNA ligase subunit beta [Candidatus Omnitrophica bacterium]|nr:glycine--tRNA ligase subunit beta [Candidatus Omnitrophota bacterium]